MENTPNSPVTSNPVTSSPAASGPATNVSGVESATKPEGKKSKVWLIVLVIVLILLCAGISVAVIFVRNMSTDIISDLSDTKQVEENEELADEETDESSELAGEWIDVYSESGTGSKNTKIFQIDRVNSNGWKIIYTFEGSSDTSTLYIETFSPPLTYGDAVVEYVYEGGEVVFAETEGGPSYLGIGTDDDSSWTVNVQQLMNDLIITNELDDSEGEWVDIYSQAGTGSANTKVFQIEEDGNKGWEIIYTFEGSSDTSVFFIEKVSPQLTYGSAVVEYVYDDGTAVFDETYYGSYYLRVGTDDDSSWTVEIRQLLD